MGDCRMCLRVRLGCARRRLLTGTLATPARTAVTSFPAFSLCVAFPEHDYDFLPNIRTLQFDPMFQSRARCSVVDEGHMRA